jgi:uncharacterized protein YdhG (YjbR/CyaY superfamily)
MATINDYLDNVTPAQRAEFERVRGIVKQLTPDAGEKISYGIPTFTYNGTYLLYFGAFKNHMSLFPGAALSESVKAKLSNFKVAKGTIQYTEDYLIPGPLIKEIVRARLAQIRKHR